MPSGSSTGSPEFAELGFERIYVHHVGKEQRAFIEFFGERVLPNFAGSAS